FSKHEQRSWIKIEYARGHTACQCHQGLHEACGESALPYRTVARWVKAFNEGRQNVADACLTGRPSVSEEVYALSLLLESDRRHTIRELARETGLAHTTVLHILKERLAMRKIASPWVPHDLTEMQKWLRYDAARNHLERYEREGEAFLRLLYHPPYSPDLEILQAVDRFIQTINTTGTAKGILQLPHRWQWVVHNAGDYIEGQ
ncbi:hypothetical protein B7P43_G17675, partial [Cryptotermes secundus]